MDILHQLPSFHLFCCSNKSSKAQLLAKQSIWPKRCTITSSVKPILMAMAALGLHLNLHHFSCLSSSGSQPKSEPRDKDSTRYTVSSSCALRRTAPFIKDSYSLRGRAPCCMSVEVDNEPVEVDTQIDDLSLNTRREERFAVVNTGKWECRSCGYTYDQFVGDNAYPIAAGTEFGQLPEDWRCPTCGAARSYFNSKSVEIAGFAENQKFGLGTNSLTAGQKSILIYGSLLLFFLLFLSGYFLP